MRTTTQPIYKVIWHDTRLHERPHLSWEEVLTFVRDLRQQGKRGIQVIAMPTPPSGGWTVLYQ